MFEELSSVFALALACAKLLALFSAMCARLMHLSLFLSLSSSANENVHSLSLSVCGLRFP
jgi:hypothetical protein